VFNIPGGTGIRVDTAAYAEGVIPPYYDSLIAKLVARGRDRDEAISRMSRALEMFVVEGIYTTIPLHQRIMRDPDFRAGNFDTKFMERFLGTSFLKLYLPVNQKLSTEIVTTGTAPPKTSPSAPATGGCKLCRSIPA
jgi:acetyl/propionyl-CoA carboxylase alpha subunit